MASYGSITQPTPGRSDRVGRTPRTGPGPARGAARAWRRFPRSEEHTSELQSRGHLVCRLLLEKKKEGISKMFLKCPHDSHVYYIRIARWRARSVQPRG